MDVNQPRTIVKGIWKDVFESEDDQTNGRLRVYAVKLAEKAQRRGIFKRGYDRVTIQAGNKYRWAITMPSAPTIPALLSRTLSSFDGGGIEYRVYAGAQDIVLQSPSTIKYKTAGALVGFDRISTVDLTSAIEVDYTEIPRTGGGSSSPGGLFGSEDLRIQPNDATFVIEAFNRASQPTEFTVYLTWIETEDIHEI